MSVPVSFSHAKLNGISWSYMGEWRFKAMHFKLCKNRGASPRAGLDNMQETQVCCRMYKKISSLVSAVTSFCAVEACEYTGVSPQIWSVFCSTASRRDYPNCLENGFKFSNRVRPPIAMLPSAHLSASFRTAFHPHHVNATSLGECGRLLRVFSWMM